MTSLSDMQRLPSQSGVTASQRSVSSSTDKPKPPNQLDFQQAMRDFKFMFPTMEEEVIEAVLRANNGLVDATVDQLLTMSVDIRDCVEEADDFNVNIADVPTQPTTLNGVKLKPSHKMAANVSYLTKIPDTEHSQYTNVLSDNSLTVEDNLLLIDSPDLHSIPATLETTSTAKTVVSVQSVQPSSLPLLIDAPISDFLNGLPAYTANQTTTASQIQDVSTPKEQIVTSKQRPKATRPIENAPVVTSKVPPASDASIQARRLCRWSPPLLGNLPDHFLRILPDNTTPPPLPQKMLHHHSASVGNPSQMHRTMSPGVSNDRTHHRSHHHPSTNGTQSLGRTMSESKHHSHHHTSTGGHDHSPTTAHHHHVSSRGQSLRQAHGQQTLGVDGRSSSLVGQQQHHSNRKATHGRTGDTHTMHVTPVQQSQQRSVQAPSSAGMHLVSDTTPTDMGDVISPYLRHKMAENERRLQEVDADLDPDVLQMLKDERLALVLQNEEFLNELRNDKDFLRVLEKDRLNATAFEPASGGDGDSSRDNSDDHNGVVAAASNAKDENAEFRRQLKYMGGSSRKTLMAKAKQFFSRKKRTPKPVLIKGPIGVSTMHLLDDDDTAEESGVTQPSQLFQVDEDDQWIPHHATVQRPLNSANVIITRSNDGVSDDIC